MKIGEDNHIIEQTSAVYIENDIKLLWPIESGFIYDENQIGQWHDHSIGLIYIKTKTKLSTPIEWATLYDEN